MPASTSSKISPGADVLGGRSVASLNPWRDVLAGIVARGVAEGAFAAPAEMDDFTRRFIAVLDGLAIQRLQHRAAHGGLAGADVAGQHDQPLAAPNAGEQVVKDRCV